MKRQGEQMPPPPKDETGSQPLLITIPEVGGKYAYINITIDPSDHQFHHEKEQTYHDVYSHVLPSLQREAMDQLDRQFKPFNIPMNEAL